MIRFQFHFDKCRGQCYDGASNMLGKKSGVVMQIKELQPKAHYTHCHGHSISHSVKEVTKRSSPGKHYGCCRRHGGAHQILSKTGKHLWLHK